MRQHILCGLMIALLTLSFSVNTVSAGPFEDGVAAADRYEYGTAVDLLRPLAEQGDARLVTQASPRAQFDIGVMYDAGYGVTQDSKKAVQWYRLAAKQGYGLVALGAMYRMGHGVTQDFVRAHMWYNLAAAQGDEDGEKLRDFISQQMTPQQIAEAQAMARKCEASKYKDCD